MTRIIVLVSLKPGKSAADYEQWALTTDLPTVNALQSVNDFTLFRTTGVLGSEDKPPYDYIEIIDVADMDLFGQEVSTEAMGRIAAATLALVTLASMGSFAQRGSRAPAPPAALAGAAPRIERPVPFKLGETLNWDVSWSSYLTAGSAISTVREKKPSFNSTAYYIVAEGRPTPLLSKLYSLYYKVDTLLDAYTLLPQRGSVYSEEGKRHRFKTTRFDRSQQKAYFEYQSGNTVKADFAVPAFTQDALSAIYVLRSIPLKAGDHMTMPVSDDGMTYRLAIDVGAAERIRTPIGEMSAWKVRPVLTDDKGRAVPAMPLDRIRVPVLVVHHEQDACALCSFADVPALMARLRNAPRSQLLAFTGGDSRGDPCEAFAHHGFNGLERDVVQQIAAWIVAR